MELPSQEGDEMPIPLNSTYGGGHGHGHMIHHHHHHDHHPPPAPPHNHIIIPSSTAAIAVAGGGGPGPGPAPQIPSTGPPSAIDVDHLPPFKKIIRYRECLKNHAAAMGGNATDGCGEFMPSGDEGTLEALTCSACSCHRNFHRKETDGDAAASCDTCSYHNVVNPRIGRKLFMGHHHHKGYLGAPPDSIGAYHHHAAGALMSSRAVQPHQMIMSYNMGGGGGGGGGSLPSESDEQEGNNGGGGLMVRPPHMVKKRFRTKFSQEQKEKMLNFAEKVGWKIQKQEEGVVQQFCQEVGVKRRVLKVWMHNNKHTLAKKTLQSDPQIQSLGTD